MGYLDRLHKGHGLTSHVVETLEYAGASYGFGYLQNRYREKASVMGVPADLLAGVVLKTVVLGSELMGKGVSGGFATLLSNVGNAGIGAYFHTLGAGHGAQKSGVKRLLISEKDVEKAKAALPGATILGDLPKAPKGDFLSAAELAEMAR
jgi:hypothetical protein